MSGDADRARLSTALASGPPLVLDGAMGTQLIASGFDIERDFLGTPGHVAALALTRPEQVRAIHESYLDAGARAVRTHTFQASATALGRHGLAERAHEIHAEALDAAREAVAAFESERAAFVLGSIGPAVAPGADATAVAHARADHADQARWLAPGVAALVLETFAEPRALEAALSGAQGSAPDVPRWVSVVASADGSLLADGDLADAAALAVRHDAALLAVNCVELPVLEPALRTLREHWSGPLGAWPNAGPPDRLAEPEHFAEHLAELAASFDLRAVGACCGSRPAHVAALARALGAPGTSPEPRPPVP